MMLKDEYIDGLNVVATGMDLDDKPFMLIADDDGEIVVASSVADRNHFSDEHIALIKKVYQEKIREALIKDTGFYPTKEYLKKCYREIV